jgi:hypothetical protein
MENDGGFGGARGRLAKGHPRGRPYNRLPLE